MTTEKVSDKSARLIDVQNRFIDVYFFLFSYALPLRDSLLFTLLSKLLLVLAIKTFLLMLTLMLQLSANDG